MQFSVRQFEDASGQDGGDPAENCSCQECDFICGYTQHWQGCTDGTKSVVWHPWCQRRNRGFSVPVVVCLQIHAVGVISPPVTGKPQVFIRDVLPMPSPCLVDEHSGWGVLAAASVLLNFLMRHLFPAFPNCPALFSLHHFPQALFTVLCSSFLSFRLPHHPYITRTCLTRLTRGWPQFSPFIHNIPSGRRCGSRISSPEPSTVAAAQGWDVALVWQWHPGPLSVTPCGSAP